MNILPIVFASLMIFSFITFNFFQEHKSSILSEKSIKEFYTTSRNASNIVAQRLYKRIKTQSAPSPSGAIPSAHPKPHTKPRTFHSQRDIFPPLDISKFNLKTLFELQTEPKNHPLYEICASLLRTLYEESLFKPAKQENLEYDLLNALLKISRTKNSLKTLCDLYPDDPRLKEFFYKMLKGTNSYDLTTKRGIAPLEDFFVLEKSPTIYFAFASQSLLKAIFGEKAALKILSEEKKKYEANGKKTSLTKDELTALLSSNPLHSSLILELGEHLDFSQKNPKRILVGKKDPQSGLTVKKKI